MGKLSDVRVDMRLAWLAFDWTVLPTTPAEEMSLDSTGLAYAEFRTSQARRWLGVVGWMDGSSPFATRGDSGALVYTDNRSAQIISIPYSRKELCTRK
jgi:hypothetical protein